MNEYPFNLTEVLFVHTVDYPNEPELGAIVIVTDTDYQNHIMVFEKISEAIEEAEKVSFAIEQAIAQSN